MRAVADHIVIEPRRGWATLRLRELWAYRELLLFLIWRDTKVRYRQTALGAAWAVIQPLTTMVIFSVIFGHFAKLPSDGVPYPLFAYAALLPWNLFASAVARSTGSVVGNAQLVKKVYFPRLIIPVAGALNGLMDFAISFVVLLGFMAYYRVTPSVSLLAVPGLVVLVLTAAVAIGCWLSALNARFRDVGHAVPFVVQVWMYASPVAYATSLVPERWRTLYALNPMVGIIEGFRAAVLGTGQIPFAMLGVAAGIIFVLLVSGALYFRRMERTFADVV